VRQMELRKVWIGWMDTYLLGMDNKPEAAIIKQK
jgi:hypothetical protein